MNFTIVTADNAVFVNGRRLGVDCSALAKAGIHAVQWRGDSGEVEYAEQLAGGTLVRPRNTITADRSPFQPFLDAWEAARAIADAPPPIETIRDQRILAASAEKVSIASSGYVEVDTSAGKFRFGTDEVTRLTIERIVVGIFTGATANPRGFTPKGYVGEVQLTHADFQKIQNAISARLDHLAARYLAHKFAIKSLPPDAGVIAAYDVTKGWE